MASLHFPTQQAESLMHSPAGVLLVHLQHTRRQTGALLGLRLWKCCWRLKALLEKAMLAVGPTTVVQHLVTTIDRRAQSTRT